MVLTFKCLHDRAQTYNQELVPLYEPAHSICSSSKSLLRFQKHMVTAFFYGTAYLQVCGNVTLLFHLKLAVRLTLFPHKGLRILPLTSAYEHFLFLACTLCILLSITLSYIISQDVAKLNNVNSNFHRINC